MVFFSCDKCGDSLKKQQVDKHRNVCSGHNGIYHCIDCNTAFRGEEYRSHTKCVSEAQRYGGANYVAVQPKGEAKQDAFMQRLNEAIAEALISGKGGKNKVLYERLQQYQNVPRKEAKFRNFVKSSLNCRNEATITDLWQMVAEVLRGLKEEKTNQSEKVNDVTENGLNGEMIKQNGTHSEEALQSGTMENVDTNDASATNAIDEKVEKPEKLHRIIKRVLAANSDGVPVKKLRKELHKITKRSLEEIDEILPAKLAKANAIEVDGVVKTRETACTHCPVHCCQ